MMESTPQYIKGQTTRLNQEEKDQLEILKKLQGNPEFNKWVETIQSINTDMSPLDDDVRSMVISLMKEQLTEKFDYTFKEHIDEFNKLFIKENITNLEQQQQLIDEVFRDLDDNLFATIKKALFHSKLLLCHWIDYVYKYTQNTTRQLIDSEYVQNMLLVAQLISLMVTFIDYPPLKIFLFSIPGLGNVCKVFDRVRPALNYLLYIQIIFAGTVQIMKKLSLTRYCSEVIGNIYENILHTITTEVDNTADEASLKALAVADKIYIDIDKKIRDSLWAAAQTCLIQFIGATPMLKQIGSESEPSYEYGIDMNMLRTVDENVSRIPEVVELSQSIWTNEQRRSSNSSSNSSNNSSSNSSNYIIIPNPKNSKTKQSIRGNKTGTSFKSKITSKPISKMAYKTSKGNKSLSSNSTSSFFSVTSNPDGTINDNIIVDRGIIRSSIDTKNYIDLFEKLSQISKIDSEINKSDFYTAYESLTQNSITPSNISSLEKKIKRSHSTTLPSKFSGFDGRISVNALPRSNSDPGKKDIGASLLSDPGKMETEKGGKRRTKRRKSKRTKRNSRRIKRRSNRKRRRFSKR